MNRRHRDEIRQRKSVLDRDQAADAGEPPVRTAGREDSRPFRKLIPFVILAVMGFLIAREEIPAVASWWERMVSPDDWLARRTCLDAALARAENRAFARVLKSGRINKTVDGLYIDRIVLGEMGPTGEEESVRYSCYVDGEGKLVKLNRLDAAQAGSTGQHAPDKPG